VGYSHFREGVGALVIYVVLVCGTECELGMDSEVCSCEQKRLLERMSSFFIVKGKKIIVGTALREVGRKNCLAQFNLATVHFGSPNIFVEHLVRT
jgi:hypothetical protein